MLRFNEEISKKEYFQFAINNNIPLDKIRYLEKESYKRLIKSNTLDSHQYLMFQPLQSIYFENYNLISFNCNCISGGWLNGIIKITWNRSGMYDIFPPKNNDWFHIQTKINADSIFQISKPLLNLDDKKEKEIYSNKKYTIFVYWGLFMDNRSKNFLKQIHKNLKLSNKKEYEVYYIITDGLYRFKIVD
jgi:hypothetical protein